jgi:hypothetical protein
MCGMPSFRIAASPFAPRLRRDHPRAAHLCVGAVERRPDQYRPPALPLSEGGLEAAGAMPPAPASWCNFAVSWGGIRNTGSCSTMIVHGIATWRAGRRRFVLRPRPPFNTLLCDMAAPQLGWPVSGIGVADGGSADGVNSELSGTDPALKLGPTHRAGVLSYAAFLQGKTVSHQIDQEDRTPRPHRLPKNLLYEPSLYVLQGAKPRSW